MTISSPVFTVSATGITAPSYEEILDYFKTKAKGTFGDDINLDSDTQDGQLLAIFSSAINDLNAQAIAVFNAYNPSTAVGVALDGAVKTNGISRHEASHSSVDLTIIGQAGTVITNGYALDSAGNRWNLPETVSIPLSGEVVATATADSEGAISAPAGSITTIGTPTLGWQSVTNKAAAVEGSAESDAELRYRQTLSTMQPTMGLWDGLVGSIQQLDGVQSVAGRHNDTGSESSEGIPAHSIAVVVSGGAADEIAETIYKKKSQGVSTYGSTTVEYIDSLGNVNEIAFSRPTDVAITIAITLKATDTWLTTNEDDVKTRLSAYINGLAIGEKVDIMKCVSEVVRDADIYDPDFYLESITLNGSAASVDIAWNEKASTSADSITITVE
mgnify:CR=1 FL=1